MSKKLLDENNVLFSLKQRCIINPVSGCWNWTGAKTGHGYAQTRLGAAHRLVWITANGPITAGLYMCAINAIIKNALTQTIYSLALRPTICETVF